jgi:SAM-dependent methyltransferase
MDVTNRYVLDFALRFAASHPGAEILDFGCGAGRLVREGLDAGLRIRGADIYYSGSNDRVEAQSAGLLGTAISEISGGRLPFPDASLDLVVNNQVMEHVADLDAALAEISRVLKNGGVALSIFPARDVWREGHIGIPFAHRLPRGSRLRFGYTWVLRALGLGTWKEQAPTARQWASDKLAWIDAHTHYRSRGEIFRAFERHFQNEPREAEYIRFRLRNVPRRAPLARLLDLPGASPLAVALFRKLAFLAIVSRKDVP